MVSIVIYNHVAIKTKIRSSGSQQLSDASPKSPHHDLR